MSKSPKTKESRPKEERHAPDYITWQDFNQMLVEKGDVPSPTKDSRGDTAFDEAFEVRLGEEFLNPNFVNENPEDEDSGDAIIADAHSTLDNEMGAEDLMDEFSGVVSSSRPDPSSEHLKEKS